MSYRVGTPNYNLPLTEGTDKRDWADTNQAFQAVDTALKAATDNAASASSAASTAQQTADNAASSAAAAQTAAGNAQTAASTAGELAQAAKSRADSAYAKAGTVDENRGDIEVIRKVIGSSSITWSALISSIASDIEAQYAAGKHIGLRVNVENSAILNMPLTVREPNGNWAFVIPRIFTGALLVYNISKAGTSYRYGIWNSTNISATPYGDESGNPTANCYIELVVYG